MRMTRQYKFAASHRLHSPQLGEEENQRVYGKCNNPFGHGHDYVLQVVLEGTPDPATGLLVRLEALDDFVDRILLREVRNRNLNAMPVFETLVPTTENLALVADGRLRKAWPAVFGDGPSLAGVRVLETARNSFETPGGRDRQHALHYETQRS
ncbi:MAG: 6-pyruvoyl tetrahydrobiopterin synthase [Acidobacteria bacterium]|nr:6-pyruvoyl tetrahydrobiopterin synthase [Acidobacteriota bacterium]